MKKILNDPYSYVDEMLVGLCAAHPEHYMQTGEGGRVIARAGGAVPGKVGIVTGGGSGHLPVFTGYVGTGLLDACAIGDVFASPSVEQMADAMRAANGGAGVLRLYGNYGGDVMNFDMAGDMLEMEDIPSTTVLLADDVASASRRRREATRRRRHGLRLQDRRRGGRAEGRFGGGHPHRPEGGRPLPLHGAALTPCTVPQAGKPTFEIAEDEMEMGMGIHGEPGVWRGKLRSADAIAAEIVDALLADMPLASGDRVSPLINSLGATPPEELYILYRYVKQRFDDLGVTSSCRWSGAMPRPWR